MHNKMHRSLLWGGSAVLLYCISLFKFNLAVDQSVFKFTGVSFVGPLIGTFLSIHEIMLLIGTFTFLKWMNVPITLNFPLNLLTFGLPTLMAAMFWNIARRGSSCDAKQSDQSELISESNIYNLADIFFRVVTPAFCITLFVLHPIGSKAYAISLFWLIPAALFFIEKFIPGVGDIHYLNVFSTALSSTFIMHAVGSLMWLYTGPHVTPEQWISWIPTTGTERLIFAIVMSVVYLVGSNLCCRFSLCCSEC